MQVFDSFSQLHENYKQLDDGSVIYINALDFDNLNEAIFYVPNTKEYEEHIKVDGLIIPKELYNKSSDIGPLIGVAALKQVFLNMELLPDKFTLQEYLDAFYYFLEEDDYLY